MLNITSKGNCTHPSTYPIEEAYIADIVTGMIIVPIIVEMMGHFVEIEVAISRHKGVQQVRVLSSSPISIHDEEDESYNPDFVPEFTSEAMGRTGPFEDNFSTKQFFPLGVTPYIKMI